MPSLDLFCDLALHKARPRPMAFRLTSGDKYNFQGLWGQYFLNNLMPGRRYWTAGGTPQQRFVFPHLSGWVRLGDNGSEGSHFDAKIGKSESVGELPQVKKSKSSESSPL